MKLASIVVIATLSVAVSGCATIIKGTSQTIAIVTPPAQGAQCTLVNSQGTWNVTSPGNATVHRTKTKLDVTCKKDGYQDASVAIKPHFNGVTFGNIILGGGIGAVVDAATGSDFSYPEIITMPMTPASGSVPPVTPATGTTVPAAAPIKPTS